MNQPTQDSLSVSVQAELLEELTGLTLEELCRGCSAPRELVLELVEEGVIVPIARAGGEWHFSGLQLRHARVALRLQRDLGLNPAGAALALQLMEELDTLRARLQALGVRP